MKPINFKKISPDLNRLIQERQEPKMTLYNVTWEQYETLATTLMDCCPTLRMI